MTPATLRIRLLGELDLRHDETPVAPLGSAMVELQLDLNRRRSFAAVRAAADATTPTRLEEFLSEMLP
jgi:hypothetical protein